MRILIERFRYRGDQAREALGALAAFEGADGRFEVNLVGYFYNASIDDFVFILPKVVLTEAAGAGALALGLYDPERLAAPDGWSSMQNAHREFFASLAVWTHRTISVFRSDGGGGQATILQSSAALGADAKNMRPATLLDALLALQQFGRDNKDYYLTVARIMRGSYSRVNWSRTVGRQSPMVQSGVPLYLEPVVRKRVVDLDEELLVIFYSILSHASERYGFAEPSHLDYPLIAGPLFDAYLCGLGKARLLRIRHNYFSDRSLRLWSLCYAFFDAAHRVSPDGGGQTEYLLAGNFHAVFEAVIDKLVGDSPLPDGMTRTQDDGKVFDHLFVGQDLVAERGRKTYYIGDSKYYKAGSPVGREAVCKQYTYARNVTQWNVERFLMGQGPLPSVMLRDDVTEGYGVIPNFFVSAKIDPGLRFSPDGLEKAVGRRSFWQSQFPNRLYDRDTQCVYHLDVNFLFALSLYARGSHSQIVAWRDRVREKIGREIRGELERRYDFYVLTPKGGSDSAEFIGRHFKMLIGKLRRSGACPPAFSLALERGEACLSENRKVLEVLAEAFDISGPVALGEGG